MSNITIPTSGHCPVLNSQQTIRIDYIPVPAFQTYVKDVLRCTIREKGNCHIEDARNCPIYTKATYPSE